MVSLRQNSKWFSNPFVRYSLIAITVLTFSFLFENGWNYAANRVDFMTVIPGGSPLPVIIALNAFAITFAIDALLQILSRLKIENEASRLSEAISASMKEARVKAFLDRLYLEQPLENSSRNAVVTEKSEEVLATLAKFVRGRSPERRIAALVVLAQKMPAILEELDGYFGTRGYTLNIGEHSHLSYQLAKTVSEYIIVESALPERDPRTSWTEAWRSHLERLGRSHPETIVCFFCSEAHLLERPESLKETINFLRTKRIKALFLNKNTVTDGIADFDDTFKAMEIFDGRYLKTYRRNDPAEADDRGNFTGGQTMRVHLYGMTEYGKYGIFYRAIKEQAVALRTAQKRLKRAA